MINEYVEQANEFLSETMTAFEFEYMGKSSPDWARNGFKHDHYVAKLISKRNGYRLVIPFWDSEHNTEKKRKKTITAYDILSCVSGEIDIDENFDDFLNNFGYEITSEREYLRLKKIHLDLIDNSRTLHKMYNETELDQLREIC